MLTKCITTKKLYIVDSYIHVVSHSVDSRWTRSFDFDSMALQLSQKIVVQFKI